MAVQGGAACATWIAALPCGRGPAGAAMHVLQLARQARPSCSPNLPVLCNHAGRMVRRFLGIGGS